MRSLGLTTPTTSVPWSPSGSASTRPAKPWASNLTRCRAVSDSTEKFGMKNSVSVRAFRRLSVVMFGVLWNAARMVTG